MSAGFSRPAALTEEPITLEDLSTEFDISRGACGRSRFGPSKKVQEAVRKAALERASALRVVEGA